MDNETPEIIADIQKEHIRITIPVGGIDFVRKFLVKENAADAKMTPLEIPEYLCEFAGREYIMLKGPDIIGITKAGMRFLTQKSSRHSAAS